MINPYYAQAITIGEKIKDQLPNGLNTTFESLLEVMSHCDSEQVRDVAHFIRFSEKSEEMSLVFNFAISLLQQDVMPIRETIYDAGIDGFKELNDHIIDKYGDSDKKKDYDQALNIFWLVFKLPAKGEMRESGLIF